MSEKRPQFGNRHLTNPEQVFQHNAWDNVEWDEEQEAEARRKVQVNSQRLVDPDKQAEFEADADKFWDEFYGQHQNRFFKDRHWLFTEFPELLCGMDTKVLDLIPKKVGADEDVCCKETVTETTQAMATVSMDTTTSQPETDKHGERSDNIAEKTDTHTDDKSQLHVENHRQNLNLTTNSSITNTGENLKRSDSLTSDVSRTEFAGGDETSHNSAVLGEPVSGTAAVTQEQVQFAKPTMNDAGKQSDCEFPGKEASFRVFEVGCGVGNTVFPILQTNNDSGVYVYCCDLSATAIKLVKDHDDYDTQRCHAFVCDVTNQDDPFPFPDESLDVITLIFVLSAIHPDNMRDTVQRLSRALRPGGVILFRDYGRYDLAQLRFKNGRCLSENFYVRGDGTRVYFFTQEELGALFVSAGLEKRQNYIDRRLQVNRGKMLKMYRVWVQCKYAKPMAMAEGIAADPVGKVAGPVGIATGPVEIATGPETGPVGIATGPVGIATGPAGIRSGLEGIKPTLQTDATLKKDS